MVLPFFPEISIVHETAIYTYQSVFRKIEDMVTYLLSPPFKTYRLGTRRRMPIQKLRALLF